MNLLIELVIQNGNENVSRALWLLIHITFHECSRRPDYTLQSVIPHKEIMIQTKKILNALTLMHILALS